MDDPNPANVVVSKRMAWSITVTGAVRLRAPGQGKEPQRARVFSHFISSLRIPDCLDPAGTGEPREK